MGEVEAGLRVGMLFVHGIYKVVELRDKGSECVPTENLRCER